MIKFTAASLDDLDFLTELEQEAFPSDRQSSRRSLRQSINSPHQEVILAWNENPVGAAVMQHFKHSTRLVSIAIKGSQANKGYGKLLLEHCEAVARSKGQIQMILEADQTKPDLIAWYTHAGYIPKVELADYYSANIPALRMSKNLCKDTAHSNRLKNIVVTESPLPFLDQVQSIECISPEQYLSEERFQRNASYRVFNLCNTYTYKSKGYYISLLATARDHRVIPNAAMIQDFTSTFFIQCLYEEIDDLLNKTLAGVTDSVVDYTLFLGHETDGTATRLSRSLYKLFEAPLVHFKFIKTNKWLIESVSLGQISSLCNEDENTLKRIAVSYFSQKKFNRPKVKNYEYDLAILVNPDEQTPPSNSRALQRFKQSAEKNGFFVEFIDKKDMHRINEFDALFIRETTAVNNHTYEISRYAHAEGLIVIDDPWSILKCSNKFYLQERMKRAGISMPEAMVVTNTEASIKAVLKHMDFPLILKEPDSAFSLGVFKVKDPVEFENKCHALLENSEFIIVQEYIYSDYDWRIGILDNQPLFACKYYMAKDHWQIYNWNAQDAQTEGAFSTLPLHEVPKDILNAALLATSHIGDGLYGVDLKYVNGKCYLIEVNDNPNIDYGIEDLVSGMQLYDTITSTIKARIMKARNINKYITL